MHLNAKVQNYEWGKLGNTSYVSQLAGHLLIKEDVPYAELWMGTHPNGPSEIVDTKQSLTDFIQKNPEVLGEKCVETFGKQLPYLFKVLSIAKALSIQVHPDKKSAEQLFQKYPEIYKDANHKPELAIAITPFEALCGFRPIEEIKTFLESVPELKAVVGAENNIKLNTSDEAGLSKVLKECFESLMLQNHEFVVEQLNLLHSRLGTLDECSRESQLAELFEQVYQQFPNDVGCFVIYFLNYIKLNPNEALYLGPNEPHAYLSGDCVECMACSDNVIRAGLTPKFKDVNTLVQMLSYQMEPVDAKLFKPRRENEFTELYAPPVQDFAVAKIHPSSNQTTSLNLIPRSSASIFIVLNGAGLFENIQLAKGTIIFVPAFKEVNLNAVNSDLLIFQAFANV